VLLTRKPPAQPGTVPVSYSFAADHYDDGLVAVRRWTLDGRDGSLLTETITASSASGKALQVPFQEPIPSAIAASLKTVRFTPAPSKILNADPVVEWEMQVPAHGTITIGYQATVAPDGATSARLAQWVTDFNQLAVTTKPGPVQSSGSGSSSGSSSGSGSNSGSGSSSGNTVMVPDVTGHTQSSATATLQNDDFTVNPATTSNCAESSAGLVVGQNPSGSTPVQPGSSVVITVCQPPQVSVPPLIGLTESQAEATLQSDGLVPAPTTVHPCQSGEQGLVVNQDPAAESNVAPGATVGFGVAESCTISN
jgi:hypothetical protein